MQVRFFRIGVDDAEGSDELNALLAKHRILAMDRELVQAGENSFWAIAVTYDSGGKPGPVSRKRTDYREILSEQDFAVFAKLRNLRKELANRDGVPIYAVFSNEQLAAIVERRMTTLAAMREIPGIGQARADAYGEAVLEIMRDAGLPAVES